MVEETDGFVLSAVAGAGFTDADATRLAGRFGRVCAQLAENLPVDRVDVLTAQERALLVDVWSTGPSAPLVERSLPQLVADAARRRPHAVAVVGLAHRSSAGSGSVGAGSTGSWAAGSGADGDVVLTYAELEQRAQGLADRLRAAGVGPETMVGVCVPRSAALVVALLGVLRAGGAFVPLETTWPARRISEVARGAQVVALVLGHDIEDPPDLDGLTAIRLDPAGGPAAMGAVVAVVADPVAVDQENLAYAIYTSGSTGTPKGVMIRHQAICNRLRWQAGLLDLGADDVVLHKAPIGFDISINEIFLPLVVGARLVVAPPQADADPAYLLDIIREQAVTFFYVVASMLAVMLERPGVATAGRSLRHVWCGGEALRDELYQRFRAHWDARMYHGYGPAEATIGVSCRMFTPGEPHARISIGRPNPNTRIRVLDAACRPVPVGRVGELYISGLPLARGYLGDARRTAQAFVADPFSDLPGARMYRTGDLARFRGDGEIEFLGRVDNQVKFHGFRIEIEEIEHVLGRHPAVRQAVALVGAGVGGAEELRAYWAPASADAPGPGDVTGSAVAAATPGSSASVDAAGLRTWLAQRLPRHMVPTVVAEVEDLPLTPAGKIDRRAVAALRPPPPSVPAVGDATFQEPTVGLQSDLAAIWAAVLGVERVGTRDNFFDLGGHSLLLLQVQHQLERRLGRRVDVLDLFAHTTIERLADWLGDTAPGPGPRPKAGGVPGPGSPTGGATAPGPDPLLAQAQNRAARARAALVERRRRAGPARGDGPTPPSPNGAST